MAGVVPNSDPCQMITSLVLVGLGVGEGLGLRNQIAISTRGVIICRGLKMGTTAPGPILGLNDMDGNLFGCLKMFDCLFV